MQGGTGVYLGPSLAAYGFPGAHPFGLWRHEAFVEGLAASPVASRVQVLGPVEADRASLLRFHDAAHVARVEAASAIGTGLLDDGDTPAFAGVHRAAATVVGTALAALDAVVTGRLANAFVPIAGLHHARRDAAAGFCVYDDCGVVIETLRRVHGIRRVAYVDIDAHHGDGVFYAFEDDPEVFVLDVHESGEWLYPGTGARSETGRGSAVGTKRNEPLEPLADDAEFGRCFAAGLDWLAAARPEFIVLQCGADSVAGDPLAHLALSQQAHGRATALLLEATQASACGRLLALGGGGYHRANIAGAWTGVVQALVAAPHSRGSG